MPYNVKPRKAGKLNTKFIFISGGVISSVGKGVTASSIALLLESRGYRVAPVKCDAYLNVDAGTIRPQEHGEVFVTDDGWETDQDIGNYERFLDTNLSGANYITNGQLYQEIIKKERNFEYKGEDVEVALHVPEEIIRRLEKAARERKADFVICEIGGTVGEYQNILFIEANRIMEYRDGRDCAHVHVGYLPTPASVGEMKSKPVQNSVRQLIASGIQPDFLIGRAEHALGDRRRETLAWTCNIPKDHILAAPNVDSIYEVPLMLEKQHFAEKILENFGMRPRKAKLAGWQNLNRHIKASSKSKPIDIAVVGKYFETGAYKLADVYISVVEALKHAGWHNKSGVKLHWISSIDIEKNGAGAMLKDFAGIVVPGGFGSRGTDGMISAINYARTKKIPYLGLCYGMQMATIEFARNVAKIKGAHTTEVDPKTKEPVIHIMPDQEKKMLNKDYGRTMRLGAWTCKLLKGSKAEHWYKKFDWTKSSNQISERHRHRYEFNNKYRKVLEKAGLVFSGATPDGRLVEIIELKDHPFFVATQFHPEFKSHPLNPHPLFAGFIEAAKKHLTSK